jgi:hypothetical protein
MSDARLSMCCGALGLPNGGGGCARTAGEPARPVSVSTESIASSSPSVETEPCRACGAALADDQRYCLQCGERRAPMSSVLQSGPPPLPANAAPGAEVPGSPGTGRPGEPPRVGAVTFIAGIGVLLLAMGVGVLIGRASSSGTSAGPAQVITVGGAAATGSSSAPAEAAVSDDWPAGKNGFTVQLKTLPSTTTPSAVEAAKTAASAKGAPSVGALKSEDFSSLPAGHYVIYSGVYGTRTQAQKALGGLKKNFPGASVVAVSNGAGASSHSGSASGASSGSGNAKPAPPTVLKKLSTPKTGHSYEQESKNLPNVISTG